MQRQTRVPAGATIVVAIAVLLAVSYAAAPTSALQAESLGHVEPASLYVPWRPPSSA